MPKGHSKKSLEALKIGWERAKERRKEKNDRVCIICNSTYHRTGTRVPKTCSLKCLNILRTKKPGGRLGMKSGTNILCKYCKKEFYITVGLKKRGRMFCSRRCAFDFNSGPRSVQWRGGRIKEREKMRKTPEYKLWRKTVFERDSYTCVWCGQVGGSLNADHIKPFSLYPELRLDIDNGRTLCIECHKKTDSFLNNKITRITYEENF